MSHEDMVRVREGPIMSHEGMVRVREGPIVPHEGMVRVREGPIMSHEGMVSVALVFSGSLFITEQTLSEIKQRLFYSD